jgi:putative membrane protein
LLSADTEILNQHSEDITELKSQKTMAAQEPASISEDITELKSQKTMAAQEPASISVRDPRVYFAAERTLLAWIRTGIALMGFGFVVARFGLFLRELRFAAGAPLTAPTGLSLWGGTLLVLIGVVVNVASTFRYVQTLRDLNAGKDVAGRPSALGIGLALVLAVVGLGVAAYLMVMR